MRKNILAYTSIAYAHICWWKSELPKWFIAVDSVVVVVVAAALRIYGILHKCDGALWLSWVWWKIIKANKKKCYYYLLAAKILYSQHNKSKKHKQILMWSTYNLHTRGFFFISVVLLLFSYILLCLYFNIFLCCCC